MKFTTRFLAGAALSLSVACGDDGSSGSGGKDTSSGGATTGGSGGVGGASGAAGPGGGGGQGGAPCHDARGPADLQRFVVIGHPYDASSSPAQDYEVLTLTPSGELEKTGKRFAMGRPADKPIVFTPDGALGFAVQADGSIGVFALAPDGTPTVVTPAFMSDFYADNLVVSEDAKTLYVVDSNFPENGGGVHTIKIACDGALTYERRLFAAKNAAGFAFEPQSGDFLVAARAAIESPGIAHLHRLTTTPALVASVDVFGDDDALLSWMTLTRGGKHVLVGDNSSFSGKPNRVASVEVTADGLGTPVVLNDIEDPYAIAASPFDDAAIVVSGFGDAIFVLDYTPSAASPFSLRGELPYLAGSPQVPGSLAMVERGTREGLVLVTDVRGLFRVRFAANATVTDQGIFDLGGGTENIVAGVGVTP